jgi:hypothetical protein
MTINLEYPKNYTELGETYQLVLQLSLEGLVPDNECEDGHDWSL